jgi:hypothetical protein
MSRWISYARHFRARQTVRTLPAVGTADKPPTHSLVIEVRDLSLWRRDAAATSEEKENTR